MAEKFSQAFLREITSTDKRGRKVHKAWKGVLKYKVPNPDFKKKPSGEDTRKPSEKRAEVWKQVAKTFDSDEVRTKSQATTALQAWREEMEAQAQKAEEDELPRVTVCQYVDSFIDMLEAAQAIEPSTVRDYRLTAKRLEEHFSSIALEDLDPRDVQDWETAQLKSGKSASVVGKCHRLLKQVCKRAVALDDLAKNPMDPVRPPKRVAKKPNALDADGRARVVGILDGMAASPLAVAASLALMAGLREGEVCGLRWADVDLNARELTVQRSIGFADMGAYVKDTKTNRVRTVPMPKRLVEVLKQRKADVRAERLGAGIPNGDADLAQLYVVGNPLYVGNAETGGFKNPTILGREWRAISTNYKFKGTQGARISFHDLRHSYATAAIEGKADIKSVSDNMGHSNTSMTLNVYASATEEGKRRAADIVDEAMAPKAPAKVSSIADEATGTDN